MQRVRVAMALTFLHHFNAGDAALSLGFYNCLCLISGLANQLWPVEEVRGDGRWSMVHGAQ